MHRHNQSSSVGAKRPSTVRMSVPGCARVRANEALEPVGCALFSPPLFFSPCLDDYPTGPKSSTTLGVLRARVDFPEPE